MKSNIIVAGGGTLKIGHEYEVRHSRKGTFAMVVKEVNGEWISGVVTSGIAKAIMSYNVKEAGEPVTVRDVHSYFIPVTLTN